MGEEEKEEAPHEEEAPHVKGESISLGMCNSEKGMYEELARQWPADVYIIGKDILSFHTVIWSCILMSARLPLPKTVFVHGFANDREGEKKSKSVENVVDPHDMLDVFGLDSFRCPVVHLQGGTVRGRAEFLGEVHAGLAQH